MESTANGALASSPPTWVQAFASEDGIGESMEIEKWVRSLSDETTDRPHSFELDAQRTTDIADSENLIQLGIYCNLQVYE